MIDRSDKWRLLSNGKEDVSLWWGVTVYGVMTAIMIIVSVSTGILFHNNVIVAIAIFVIQATLLLEYLYDIDPFEERPIKLDCEDE